MHVSHEFELKRSLFHWVIIWRFWLKTIEENRVRINQFNQPIKHDGS